MHSLFLTSLLTALGLPLSVIAIPTQIISSSQNKLASAWFESWRTLEPSDLANIPWEKYNSVTFAFALVSFHDSTASLLI
jgi:GH18 family chitinase